jgi:hypothetical protein
MTTSSLTDAVPRRGAEYDKERPETRVAWLDQRRGGITATEIRDWGNGSKRRDIITAKVTNEFTDLSHIPAVAHGNYREPIIAQWVEENFGIAPCNYVFSHHDNPRHLASPDGVSLDPFVGALVVGSSDAALAEIKTSIHDLTPGSLDGARVLIRVEPGSAFDRANYYSQVQWQMYVMNAVTTLFVYERHTGVTDPETGYFTPAGLPEWCWIPRDQALIDTLVEQAERALEEIDAARLANTVGELPPASDLPTEEALLVAQLLAARDAEAVAAASKKQAWDALQALYLAEGKPDVSIDGGFARVTVSTTFGTRKVVNEEGMRAKAPAVVAKYEALRERYTSNEPTTSRKLTITPKNA